MRIADCGLRIGVYGPLRSQGSGALAEAGIGLGVVGCLRDPEWENSTCAIWLGFERICIERGTVVLDVEISQPIEVSEHETGTEPRSTPFFQITIDLLRFALEVRPGGVEFAIVMQVVDADLKSTLNQPFP